VTGHGTAELDPLVKEMLENQVPLRLDAQPDWGAALREAGSDQVIAKPARAGGRRLLASALGVLVLIVGAATAGDLGLSSGSPPVIDTTNATRLVEYTLTADSSLWKAGDRIAIWRLPQPGGGACVLIGLASPKPTSPEGPNPVSGGLCGGSGEQLVAPGQSMRIFLHTTRRLGGSYSWLIDGTVSPGSHIARLEVQSDAGRFPLAYSDRWFLGQLPTTSSDDLPQPGAYAIVGYDSRGNVAERLDLRQALAGSASSAGS
jgi:hypothetical protein